jgi:hypothetical protein
MKKADLFRAITAAQGDVFVTLTLVGGSPIRFAVPKAEIWRQVNRKILPLEEETGLRIQELPSESVLGVTVRRYELVKE